MRENEEDFLDIVENIKQEVEETDTSSQQFNCHQNENFVSVFDGAESTIHIKTEIKEEDPLDSKKEVKITKSVHDNVQYNCDECGRSFSSLGNRNKHIHEVHENIRFNCDKC